MDVTLKIYKFFSRVIFVTLLVSIFIKASAQEASNSWIYYNQNYIKIPVAKTGIYQLEKSKIKEYGLDPSKKLGLFKKGKQVSIAINSDNIQFFGELNDGKTDSILYRPTNSQAHQNYSLYTDTTYYFLTNLPENTSENKIVEINYKSNKSPESHFTFKEIKWLTSEYTHNDATGPVPNVRSSYFDKGAGFTGPMVVGTKKFYIKPDLVDICNGCSASKPILSLMLSGRSEGIRSVSCTFQTVTKSVEITSFNAKTVDLELPNTLNLKDSVSMSLTSGNRFSLSLYELIYERNLNLRKNGDFVLDPSKKAINLEFKKVDPNINPQFFDVSSIYNIKQIIPSSSSDNKIQVDLKGNEKLYISTDILIPEKLFRKVFEKSIEKNGDFLIVTHPKLLESANSYMTYRASVAGGSHKVALFNIKDLADEFSYGEINPLSIRNFFEIYIKNHNPKNLLIIGKSLSIYLFRKDSSDYRNLVPSYGYPSSDLLLTADFEKNDIARIATGRIPALSNEEVYNYLEKVKIKESNPTTIREKNILHLSGGKNDGERNTLKNIVGNVENISRSGTYGSDVTTFNKNTNEYIVKIDISQELNKGLSLITFLGHSGYDYTDMNVGYVTDPSYGYLENSYFPVMYYNGCTFGNSFNTYSTQADNWLMTKKRGASAVISTTTYSYLSTFVKTMPEFYKNIFESDPGLTIGENLNLVIESILGKGENNVTIKTGIHQHVILGDPSIKIFQQSSPDYTIDDQLVSEKIRENLDKNELNFEIPVYNLGKYESEETIKLELTQYSTSGEKKVNTFNIPAPKVSSLVKISISKITNVKNYEISISPSKNSSEENKSNNLFTFENNGENAKIDQENPVINIYINNSSPVQNIEVGPNPKIEILLSDNFPVQTTQNSAKIKLFLQSGNENNIPVEVIIPDSNLIFSGNNLTASYQFKDLSEGTYQVYVSGIDASGNANSNEYIKIQFKVSEESAYEKQMTIGPNPTSNCVNFNLDFKKSSDKKYNLIITDLNGQNLETINLTNETTYKWCFPNQTATGTYYYHIIDESRNSISSGKILLTN